MHPLKAFCFILVIVALLVWLQSWTHKHNPPSIFYKYSAQQVNITTNAVEATMYTACFSPARLKLSRDKNTPILLYLAIVLLGAAGDIELNPGPPITEATIYPCGICSDPCTWEQNSICCDTCKTWNHKDCLGMSTTTFRYLGNSDIAWICPTPECDNPNFSAVLFNTPVTTSIDNRYAALSESFRSTDESILTIGSSVSSYPDSPGSQIITPPGPQQDASSPTVPGTQSRKRTPTSDNFKVAVMNCQSLMNKVPQLHTFIESTDPDIVLGNESWLKPDISNSEVFPPGYNIFRKDRGLGFKKTGGGVFIMVRQEFTCSEIQLDIDTDLELIFVEIRMKDQQNVKVGSFYRPPWSDDTYMENLARALDQVNQKGRGNMWLAGDFNLPHIDWSIQQTLPGNQNVKRSNMLIDSINDHSLVQIVERPTRQQNMLDLFFTSNPTLVNRTTTVPPLSRSGS